MVYDIVNKNLIDENKKKNFEKIINRKDRYKYKQAFERYVNEQDLNKQELELNRKINRSSQDGAVAKFERGYDIVNNCEQSPDQIVKQLQGHKERTK